MYRGQRFPEVKGQYVFADNYSGRVWALDASTDGSAQLIELTQAQQLGQLGICSLTESPDGELLVIVLGAKDRSTGAILRLARADEKGAGNAVTAPVEAVPTRDMAAMRGEFAANCARCRGAEGAWDAPGEFPVPMPNLQTQAWQASRDDAWIVNVIKNGGTAVGLNAGMPPWGAVYNDEEIDLLVQIVREWGEDSR